MNRARILLLLVSLLAAALSYAWLTTPRQHRVGAATDLQLKPVSAAAAVPLAPRVEDLDFCRAQEREFRPPQKNLFGALSRPRPAPRKFPLVKVGPPLQAEKIPAPKIEPKPLALPAKPAIPPLKILGFLSRAGHKTVFLSSGTGQIYLVEEGEAFGDGLELKQITDKSLTVVNTTGEQQVLLLEAATTQRLPNNPYQSGRPSFNPPAILKQDGTTEVDNVDAAKPEKVNQEKVNPFINAIKRAQQ